MTKIKEIPQLFNNSENVFCFYNCTSWLPTIQYLGFAKVNISGIIGNNRLYNLHLSDGRNIIVPQENIAKTKEELLNKLTD